MMLDGGGEALVLREGEKIKVKVFRYNPVKDSSPHYEIYEVPYLPRMKVLGALQYIQMEIDSSIAFRWGCKAGKCGECALTVNGKPTLACKEAIVTKEVVLEPLSNFPVIRDLVVDRTTLEDKNRVKRLFLMRKKPPIKEPEPIDVKVVDTLVHLNKCIECYSCVGACPIVSTGFSPPIMIKLAKLELDPRNDEDRTLDAYLEGVFSCTTCARCEEVCPWKIEIPALTIIYLRQLLIEKGLVPKAAKAALTSIYKYGNPWAQPKNKRDIWADDLKIKIKNFASEKAEILYYVGCTASYDTRAQKIAKAACFVFHKARVDFAILGKEECCCGDPALRLGEKGLFDMLVDENVKLFEKYGIDKIVTTSPHSYNIFLNEYPKKLEVKHYTQLLLDLIEQGKLKFSHRINATVTYHDPCYLGRYNGIYEPPRKILEAIPGLTLVEMPRNKKNAFCCGGGGGTIWVDESFGERVYVKRAREAADVGANIIATACPFCLLNLEDGVKVIGEDNKIQVKDIIELVREAL